MILALVTLIYRYKIHPGDLDKFDTECSMTMTECTLLYVLLLSYQNDI